MRLAEPARLLLVVAALGGCDSLSGGPSLSKRRAGADEMALGERAPSQAEAAVVGATEGRIARGTAAFGALVRCDSRDIVFKDEESTGADRMMTERLCAALRRLAERVAVEWPGQKLRVTEAWDERGEHGRLSVHYEGRAADLTTSDVDARKLGRLASLAVDAGLDWVYYEDSTHVHVSVRRTR